MSVEIIAHRGASKYAPENTLPSFQLAYELGADEIETDIHLTKDNIPVLIHDETIDRTTNHRGYFKDFTFHQLKSLDAGNWFAKEFAGTPILSLEELLTWIKDKHLSLTIKLKNNKIEYAHIEEIVYEMLKSFQMLDRATISTFNKASVKRLSHTHRNIALLLSKRERNLIPRVKELGANAIHIKHSLLKLHLIKQSKQEKISVRVYTVNKARHMLKCIKYRCSGIITDVPDKAVSLRNFIKHH